MFTVHGFLYMKCSVEPCHEKTCFCHMQTSKAQIRLRISTFVVNCLDSIIPIRAIPEISRLWLASVAAQVSLCLTWSQTPKKVLSWRGSVDIFQAEVLWTPCVNEPPHDKTNKMTIAPSEFSDQPWHPPSLIGVFTVRMKKQWLLSYPLSSLRRLWSDWPDAQGDLSLHLKQRSFCWFCHEVAQMSCDT